MEFDVPIRRRRGMSFTQKVQAKTTTWAVEDRFQIKGIIGRKRGYREGRVTAVSRVLRGMKCVEWRSGRLLGEPRIYYLREFDPRSNLASEIRIDPGTEQIVSPPKKPEECEPCKYGTTKGKTACVILNSYQRQYREIFSEEK